jgi:hypothetical protein
MKSYLATIAYQSAGQRSTESSAEIRFLAPDDLAAALGVQRWFANRGESLPEVFVRLLCVKLYSLVLQEFREDGYLPADTGFPVYEYKCDTAGLPYVEHVVWRLGRRPWDPALPRSQPEL